MTHMPGSLCCILGAGDILDYDAVKAQIPPDAFIICADGGYRHCGLLEVVPRLLMGDFDSIATEPPGDIPRITLPVDKNYTDTAFAVEEAIRRGYGRLLMMGMLGGRLDHTMANLQSLGHCAKLGLDAAITDGITFIRAVYAPKDKLAALTLQPVSGHYFSLLSLSDRCQGVTITGAAYPLNDYPLGSLDPRAVSNEFRAGPVQIQVRGGVILVMVTPFDGGR